MYWGAKTKINSQSYTANFQKIILPFQFEVSENEVNWNAVERTTRGQQHRLQQRGLPSDWQSHRINTPNILNAINDISLQMKIFSYLLANRFSISAHPLVVRPVTVKRHCESKVAAETLDKPTGPRARVTSTAFCGRAQRWLP